MYLSLYNVDAEQMVESCEAFVRLNKGDLPSRRENSLQLGG